MLTSVSDLIRENTVIRAPSLCPEIALHLLRPDAEIWVGTADCPNPPTPFWGIAWGAGQALARWLLDNPDAVRHRRVFDLASGSGIAAIAAALAGAACVTAVDRDPTAARAIQMNAEINCVVVQASCDLLESVSLQTADIVIAADVGYAGKELIEVLRRISGNRTTVLLAEPERRGGDLTAAEIIGTYQVRADPPTEAFYIQRAFVARLLPADSSSTDLSTD